MVSICAALAFTLTARGEVLSAAETDAFITAFNAKQGATQTYQAELTQQLQLRGLKRPAESRGQLFYRAPAELLLRYDQPAGEFLLLKDADVWFKKTDRPLVHRHQVAGGANPGKSLLMLFRDDPDGVRRQFNVTVARTNSTLQVTLTPKEKDPHMRLVAIENVVREADLEVLSVRTIFEGQNQITYEFTNPRRNAPLDAALFAPPPQEPLR